MCCRRVAETTAVYVDVLAKPRSFSLLETSTSISVSFAQTERCHAVSRSVPRKNAKSIRRIEETGFFCCLTFFLVSVKNLFSHTHTRHAGVHRVCSSDRAAFAARDPLFYNARGVIFSRPPALPLPIPHEQRFLVSRTTANNRRRLR